MAESDNYDILILGSGAGGKLLAWHMGQSGKRVAVVERKWIGGSCPNVACMPSKNEIYSAKVAHLVERAGEFGITTGPVKLDMGKIRQRKRDMVEGLVARHLRNYENSGVELVLGAGKFIAPKTIEVTLENGGARVLTGEKVFINVGTHAAVPDISGLREAKPMTHIDILELDRVPPHLIVLGGGYIGLEFAQAYRRFGSKVTVLARGSQVLSKEDKDVAQEVERILSNEGIDIVTDAKPVKVEGSSGQRVKVTVRTTSGDKIVEGTDILVATGRIPNTKELGLNEAGVELDERGYIRVNDALETTAPNVWAIGECAGSPQFTHVSKDDYMIIKDNLEGGNRSTANRLVPYCLFTEPPLAHVGLRESNAKEQRLKVRVAKMPMSEVLRAAAISETQGFMKIIVSDDSDQILGFTMVGADAGEVMAVVQMAMLGGLTHMQVRQAILAHPTMSEGLSSLLASIPQREPAAVAG